MGLDGARGEELVAELPVGVPGAVLAGGDDGEEVGGLVHHVGRERPQGRDVVQVDAPAEGAHHELVAARHDVQVADVDRGQVGHLRPVLAPVDGDEDPGVGAREEHVGAQVALLHHVGDLAVGEVAGDLRPALPGVVGPVDVGRVVVPPVAVVRDVGGARLEAGRLDLADPARGRRPAVRELGGDVPPRLPPVGAHPEEPAVGAGPQHPRVQGRLGHRVERAVGGVAHLGLRVAAVPPGHVGSQDLPVPAPLGEPEEVVAAHVQHARVVAGDLEGGVPVPPEREPALGAGVLRQRPELGGLPGTRVQAVEVPELELVVADRGAVGGDRGVVAVAAEGVVPVEVGDPHLLAGAGGGAPGAVVLGPPADLVGHLGGVHVDLVELAGRDDLVRPGLAVVAGDVDPAVVAQDPVGRVVGVHPHGVVVDVDPVLLLEPHPGDAAAAVLGDVQEGAPEPQPVRVLGVQPHLVVVVVGDGGEVVDPGPGVAPVVAPEETAVGAHVGPLGAVRRLDDGVDDVGLLGVDRQPDAAQLLGGQPPVVPGRGELGPALAPVGGAPDAAAVAGPLHVAAAPAQPVPRGGEEDVRVLGVQLQVDEARGVVDGEHLLPAPAAVGRPVDAPLRVGAPEVAEGGHPRRLRVVGMDGDAADLGGLLEPDVLPAPAAVGGAVDAVAPGVRPQRVPLAGADPDDVGVGGGDGHVGDRPRALVVEDRRPGGAGVPGLPEPAGGQARVDGGAAVALGDGQRRDAAGRVRGADEAGLELLQQVGRQTFRVSPLAGPVGARLLGPAADGADGEDGRREQEGDEGGRQAHAGAPAVVAHGGSSFPGSASGRSGRAARKCGGLAAAGPGRSAAGTARRPGVSRRGPGPPGAR